MEKDRHSFIAVVYVCFMQAFKVISILGSGAKNNIISECFMLELSTQQSSVAEWPALRKLHFAM